MMRYPNLGYGAWDDEPDRVEFTHAGLECVLSRAEFTGAWCGYVRVPDDSPLYGVAYCEPSPALSEALEARKEMGKGKFGPMTMFSFMLGDGTSARPDFVFDVHGSLTYSGWGDPGWAEGSRRAGSQIMTDDGWWYGFDCAHAGDLSPRIEDRTASYGYVYGYIPDRDGEYRTVHYARAETERLAEQIAEMWPSVEAQS